MDIKDYLKQHENKDLLRFVTCGSVDDGKSTLIGRLLYDTKQIYEDQLAAIVKDSKIYGSTGDDFDPSLLTDGLKAEREQGITIDVAYRYFSTEKRKFIIADSPGHEQYTRNMATGASNSNLAIILVDSLNGITTQTRRHSFIVSLLGIKHIIVAINKMDLVNWSEEKFNQIKAEYLDFIPRLDFSDIHFIPLSALKGDNVASRGTNLTWFNGKTLLSTLEDVTISTDRNLVDMRLPIQNVIRPDQKFRGYAGKIASGVIKKGMDVVSLPSKQTTKIKSIITYDGELEQAFAPMSVVVTFENEIDVSRGTLLAPPKNIPIISDEIDAMLIWMSEDPVPEGSSFFLKHCTSTINSNLSEIIYQIDVNTLNQSKTTELNFNSIARVRIALHRSIYFDSYKKNSELGSFILIDKLSNKTVAAGMIIERHVITDSPSNEFIKSKNISIETNLVSEEARREVTHHEAITLWLTGLSGSGKSTLAKHLEKHLISKGKFCFVLDGDNIRTHLNRDLGFSAEDRKENIRRVAEVAKLMNDAGLIVISAFISPFSEDRESARQIIGEKQFKEVFLNLSLDECEKRDPKGLYKKARAGEIPNFTGIDSPYDIPENPDLIINTSESNIDIAVQKIVNSFKL